MFRNQPKKPADIQSLIYTGGVQEISPPKYEVIIRYINGTESKQCLNARELRNYDSFLPDNLKDQIRRDLEEMTEARRSNRM